MAQNTTEILIPAHLQSSSRKYTVQQFLAEFAMRGGKRTRVFDLTHPITIVSVEADDRTRQHHRITKSTEFFGVLRAIANENHIITTCRWAGARLGAHGLYILNTALRTYPKRKGGKNLVRHWMEEVAKTYSPLRCDIARLFSYLEIRPLFTQIPNPTTQPLNIMFNQELNITKRATGGKKSPAHGSKKVQKSSPKY